jgi:hypothetical protein
LLPTPQGCRKSSNEGGDAVSTAGAVPSTTFPAAQDIDATKFTSARVCGACHQAINATWQQSMHAQAFSNGVFQAAYREAKGAYAEDRARLCLRCHAPAVFWTPGYASQDPLAAEGITCDFCHSVRAVRLDTPEAQLDVSVGRTKYGPLKHAQSPIHEVVDSELHRRSEFCAACHEYRNAQGVAVLETYSEWKAGPYAAEGKQCQDCHMPLTAGRVAALGPNNALKGVNLHDISGSHSLETVRKAVTMKILSAVRLPESKVQVELLVSNVGSGHCFPTGLPLHRAVLEVTLTDRERKIGSRTLTFEKELVDGEGVPITREHEAFLVARSVHSDTRLKPKEERRVVVTFYDAETPEGLVEASLWYQYSTRSVTSKAGTETIEPVDMKFLVASQQRRLPSIGD